MESGGNQRFKDYLKSHGEYTEGFSASNYTNNAAMKYRKMLKEESSNTK